MEEKKEKSACPIILSVRSTCATIGVFDSLVTNSKKVGYFR